MKIIYLIIFMISLLYVNFKHMNIIQHPHVTYKFQKYITTNDLIMLYKMYYNNQNLINLTLIYNAKHSISFNLFRGKINYQGKQLDLETKITVGFGLFEILIPNLKTKITFQLNSTVKYIVNNQIFIVNHASCRFYN